MEDLVNDIIKTTAFAENDNIYQQPIEPIVKPTKQIGIDLENQVFKNIISTQLDNGIHSTFDINALNSFTQVSRNRNEIYRTLDYMSEDSTIAAILETYAEDATETNDQGDIVWCESSDGEVAKYVTYLLNSLNINKHIYSWAHSLIKYGDVYLRLYRESDYENNLFNKKPKEELNQRQSLNEEVGNTKSLKEDVIIRAYAKHDKYVHYLEMAPNPAQIFELTRFGKTAAYVTTNVEATATSNDNLNYSTLLTKYQFAKNDVDLFPPTEWVHGCLHDNSSRTPEVVQLFMGEDEESDKIVYNVNRGQSLLYSTYKIWRQLSLLENSILLNRVTQSSIVRLINVEIGDMAKESVGPHLNNIKQMIEQKSALDVGKSLNEYTNPGPIVNNVYIPTRNGQGNITTSQVGGDVDVKSLADLDYYQDKFYGAMRVPKAYFGVTDDGAGFNGGTSLSIISSRYAKAIKRIQNTLIQMITDAVNLILIDTQNENYINKFAIKMLPPTTQEEVDRQENLSNKVALISDIMNVLGEVETPLTKLKILKSLLSSSLNDTEVVQLIDDEITNMEEQLNAEQVADDITDEVTDEDNSDLGSLFNDSGSSASNDSDLSSLFDDTTNDDSSTEVTDETESEDSDTLPSPADLDVGDMSDLTNDNL